MESGGSVPVFIDVERAPWRLVITGDTCQIMNQNQKIVTYSSDKTFDPAQSQMPGQSTASGSQVVTPSQNDSLTPTQNEAGQSEAKPKSATKKAAGDKGDGGLAPVPRRIRCPECQRYTAENEEKILRHIKKVHKGENPFQCYMCDYSTYNKSLFEEHVRIHQGIKPFGCSQCEYKSASKKNLKKHELIHRPNNPLKCPQCEFIARHSKALKRHAETHTDGDWLKFDSCKFRFRDLAAYKRHEKSHKLKCTECDFASCSRPLLKRHSVEKHRVQDSGKRESFCCQICRWTSSTMAKILLHLIHHPKQEVDESVVDISILRRHGIMT